jgi:chromate reductase, NAD(P)H dehydrogenase (quinone)
MAKFRLAVVVGSNRRESINRRLAHALVAMVADHCDAEFATIDDLPLYNPDLEVDRPASVHRFTAEIARADAVLIVAPEHNRSLPAVLKSAIDWGSKPMESNVWADRPVAITGTSPGAIGTALGQQHLRQIVGVLGGTVLGGEAYLSYSPDLIDDSGHVTVDSTREFLQNYMLRFVHLVDRLAIR